MKIAMWSGPRNLSTAMMYSFGNRADFDAIDEPYYAAYLAHSEVDHPVKSEVIKHHEANPVKVADLFQPAPGKHLYMKHMPHHMLSGFPLDWAQDCVNIHLLRHPARVIASYAAVREDLTPLDIGFAQQLSIFEQLGGLVIDSADIRDNPHRALERLCSEIGLAFDPAMLSWPAGPRAYDGVWAKHWYGNVHKSTKFAGPEKALPPVALRYQEIFDAVLPAYEALANHVTRL